MASSTKREPPMNAFHWFDAKKAKFVEAEPSELPRPSVHRVLLNPADRDLDFNVDGDGLRGSALFEQGFAYCWSGARANIGVNGGRYCFGCRIIAAQPVDMGDTPFDERHLCRIGISRGDDAVGNLGESLHSYGFGGTAKFSNAGLFSDYGENFSIGDTIICCVDLESKPFASIGFSKNGNWLGIANEFNAGPWGLGVVDSPMKKLQWESAMFPHILLKNVVLQLQFSTEDGLVPQEGYRPWASAVEDRKMILGPTFSNLSDCELIMMVGLPASGKTSWAEKWVKTHPEKRYILLGTNLALDQMKVPALLRKHNYGERFDCLMDRATGIFNTLLSRASKMPRNFIIDQTNVYKSARKRKLKPFADYKKIAAVIFPRPEELKFRADKRFKETGGEVPAEAVDEMLANFTLPMDKDMHMTDEYFDEIWFPELSTVESQRYLDEMKANLNLKKVSPYYPKGSFQSYNNPSPVQHSHETFTHPCITQQNRGNLSGLSLHHVLKKATHVFFDCASDNHSIHLCLSTKCFWCLGIGENCFNSYSIQHPIPTPLVSYNSSFTLHPGNNFNQYGAQGEHHYGNNDVENKFASRGSMNQLYQSYRGGDIASNAGGGSRYLLPGVAAGFNTNEMIETHPSMTAFPCISGNVHASQLTGAPPDLLAARPQNYGSTTSAPYAPPDGTRMPPLTYASFPGRGQHFGGSALPRPGY